MVRQLKIVGVLVAIKNSERIPVLVFQNRTGELEIYRAYPSHPFIDNGRLCMYYSDDPECLDSFERFEHAVDFRELMLAMERRVYG